MTGRSEMHSVGLSQNSRMESIMLGDAQDERSCDESPERANFGGRGRRLEQDLISQAQSKLPWRIHTTRHPRHNLVSTDMRSRAIRHMALLGAGRGAKQRQCHFMVCT